MVCFSFLFGIFLLEITLAPILILVWLLNDQKKKRKRLRKDRNRLKEIIEVLDKAKGLTEQQKEIKDFVEENEPCNPHKFITARGLSPKKNKIYLEFSNLREKGWLKRVKNNGKGRRKLYALDTLGKYRYYHKGKPIEGVVPLKKDR